MCIRDRLLVPVLALLTPQMQVDPVQFGVLVVVNLAVGMLTPPVGICLFVSCSIAAIFQCQGRGDHLHGRDGAASSVAAAAHH